MSLLKRRRAFEKIVLVSMGLLTGGIANGEEGIFIQIEGVPGEALAEGRTDWIDVTTLGSNSTKLDGMTVEAMKAGELVIQKRIDKSSPYLVEGILAGTVFPALQLEVEGIMGVEICYRLRGVRVIGHRFVSEKDRDEPLEEYRFGFDVAEWHDFQHRQAGLEHVGSTWNFATGEGGLLDGHEFLAPGIDPIAPVEVKPGDLFEVVVNFSDPSEIPENLVFTALPSSEGLVKVLKITGTGLQRTLSLEAGLLENGSDHLTLSVSDGTRSSTRILPIFVAGEKTAYEAYLEAYFGNLATGHPGITRPLEDPDEDDLSNVMEFFLGSNPAVSTPAGQVFRVSSETSEGGTELKFRYFRRMDGSGLSEHFEGSFGLREWDELGPGTEPSLQLTQLAPPLNGFVPMEAKVLVSPDRGQFFMRLLVRGSLR